MPALAIFAMFFAAILALMPGPQPRVDQKARVEAINYLVYRNAVDLYAVQNPGFSGTIPTSSLDIPGEWNNLRGWTNTVDASTGRVYVYGDIEKSGFYHVAQISNSAAIGINDSGSLVHPIHGDSGVTVPSFVPDGNIVSVIVDH
jgi:hypothetical protein